MTKTEANHEALKLIRYAANQNQVDAQHFLMTCEDIPALVSALVAHAAALVHVGASMHNVTADTFITACEQAMLDPA